LSVASPARFASLLASALTIWWATTPALAQERDGLLRDPDDGAFDVSGFLSTAGGFLPLVMPITEPAVGYGAAGALAFFHRPEGWDIDAARAAFDARERMAIPSVSVGAGMYTSNQSWATAAGHLGIWGGGRWRYTGAGAYLGLNLSVAQDVPGAGDVLVDYDLDGWALTQQLRYRIASTDFYVGARYDYLSMTTRFDSEALAGEPPEREASNAGAAVTLAYDSRNNTFTPDRGLFASLDTRRQDDVFGSDYDYWSGKLNVLGYFGPVDELVVGLRSVAAYATEGVPFWAKPSVRMRGVAAGRYTGEQTFTFESEIRWDFVRRWSVVGFGGSAVNLDQREALDDLERWVGAGGVGFRYLLARAYGIRGGLDFAYGEDGFAVYVTMGSAWMAF